MRHLLFWIAAALLVLAGVVAVRWQWARLMADPDVAYLTSHGGAQWIRMPQKDGPNTHGKTDFMAAFRLRFNVEERLDNAVLFVYPFRHATIFLDGVPILATGADFSTWKTPFSYDIAPLLPPGPHELVLSCVNRTGPPLVLAYLPRLGIVTGPHWEAKDHKSDWIPAVLLTAPHANNIGTQLPPVREAFLHILPLVSVIFIVSFAIAFFWGDIRRRFPRLTPETTSQTVYWLLMGSWAVMTLNNIVKISYGLGYDVDAHMQYIQFVVRNLDVPYANQGWQMFQSPLYYLLMAPLYWFMSLVLSPTEVIEALRVVPIACGALQIHLCYRIMQEIHPKRHDLQILGTLVGGFIPMNFYLSFNLGNEPLMALFASLALLLLVRIMLRPEEFNRPSTYLYLGLLLGAALLTKVTALLLFAPAAYALAIASLRQNPTWPTAALTFVKREALVLAAAFPIASWYYIRNWIHFGRPFVGGWDEVRGYIWWQEPGYRIIQHYFRFGESLVYPVYSALDSFWDGIYSTLWLSGFPPTVDVEVASYPGWNYDFLLSSAWLSLFPTAALLLGGAAILARPIRSHKTGEILGPISLAIFLAATIMLSIRIPSFSTIKASYTLALLTCYAMLAARGFEPLLRWRATRAVTYAWMTCWAVVVYAAYFVR